MNRLSAGFLLALAANACLPEAAGAQGAPTITVERAWVRPAAKGQFETWAFATISNAGQADALVGVRSVDAGSVVLRATTSTDAGRKTRSVLSIPVPAHGSLSLSADTYFIAFTAPAHAFVTGETVMGTLRFASGAHVSVSFQVSEGDGDPGDGRN